MSDPTAVAEPELLSTIDNITWDNTKGVPVDDKSKLDWIKKAIEHLKAHPDERWAGTSSGDTYIQVSRGLGSGYYVVEEFEPRRWAFIKRDPADVPACTCDLATINSKGCQCGGI